MPLSRKSLNRIPQGGLIRSGNIVYVVANDPGLVESSSGGSMWNHQLHRVPPDVEKTYLAVDDVLSE